ncbi:D-2-hydroxyacid dehydrogenase [Streptomyces gibsoniae]|uniref:D-2-hydroxyacid dehydrogenase n=1 Tax=Streptomyces gibsoniae TaxID=3075529 RepID=A0ABU2TV28_9ACTN|nr:D-2-hydroxyacid dehydrogenase [Streptomyces sp. DSM 41699]MDT0464810.1 D-2-hydroxyacid dehydrogenase [Streptomyces sp. DSM 41699]
MTTTALISLNSPYPFWQLSDRHAEELRSAFPGVRFRFAEEREAPVEIRTADVYLGWSFDTKWLNAPTRLRWTATPSAGVDHWPIAALRTAGVMLTRGYGYHGRPMAEHAIGLLLGFSRGLFDSSRLQTRVVWWKDHLADRFFDLYGQTLTIVGCGSVGVRLAEVAQAFGMHVIGVRRSPPRSEPGGIEWVPADRVREVLPRSRAIVNLLPATDETREFFDEKTFKACEPGAVFINLGRSSTVDHDALLAALDSGRLAGAALDVQPHKPPALDDPLRHHPQIVLTPKSAVFSHAYMDQAVAFFRDNLRLFLAGQPLNGAVTPTLGGPHAPH